MINKSQHIKRRPGQNPGVADPQSIQTSAYNLSDEQRQGEPASALSRSEVLTRSEQPAVLTGSNRQTQPRTRVHTPGAVPQPGEFGSGDAFQNVHTSTKEAQRLQEQRQYREDRKNRPEKTIARVQTVRDERDNAKPKAANSTAGWYIEGTKLILTEPMQVNTRQLVRTGKGQYQLIDDGDTTVQASSDSPVAITLAAAISDFSIIDATKGSARKGLFPYDLASSGWCSVYVWTDGKKSVSAMNGHRKMISVKPI